MTRAEQGQRPAAPIMALTERQAARGLVAMGCAALLLPILVAAVVGGTVGIEDFELAVEAFLYAAIFLLVTALATPVFLLLRRLLRWHRALALIGTLTASLTVHAMLLSSGGTPAAPGEQLPVLDIELVPAILLLLHLPMILLLRWLDTIVASPPDR